MATQADCIGGVRPPVSAKRRALAGLGLDVMAILVVAAVLLWTETGAQGYAYGRYNIPARVPGIYRIAHDVAIMALVWGLPLCVVVHLIVSLCRDSWKSRIWRSIIFAVCVLSLIVVPQMTVKPLGFSEAFMSGFRSWVVNTTDLDAVQAWASRTSPPPGTIPTSMLPAHLRNLPGDGALLTVTMHEDGWLDVGWSIREEGAWGILINDRAAGRPAANTDTRLSELRPGVWVYAREPLLF